MPTVNDAIGYPQGVLPGGFALNYSASMSLEAHAGDDGDAYTVVYNIDPNMAGDFLYIKNSDDRQLRIYKIRAYSTGTGGLVEVKTGVTGTPTTGIDLTPTNALVGSGELAQGTFNRNTSTADMALTGGDIFDELIFVTAIDNNWDYTGEIALEKNQTFVLTNAVDPTAIMYWTIFFYYHEKIEKP